jgi:2-iminobutanoate/2-iminopropanoate deaminase
MTMRPLTGGGAALSAPLSPGVVAGRFVFVSGQVGIEPTTGAILPGIREQTRRALANIEQVLHEAGLDRRAVVRTTVYLVDVGDFQAMNEEYGAYFAEPRPARTTVGIAGLAIDGLVVEIDAIALGASPPGTLGD